MENLEPAMKLGIKTILFENVEELEFKLLELGLRLNGFI